MNRHEEPEVSEVQAAPPERTTQHERAAHAWRPHDRWLRARVAIVLGALLAMLTVGDGMPVVTAVSWWQLALGGFIGGFGARLANGCTSGHGICGMGSIQLPSLLAVLIFLATAMITANLVSALGGA